MDKGIRTAVMIVGGEGTRLRPLTDDLPKTLVKVGGEPILYWKILWLKSFGIKHLVLGVAYRKDKIYEYMRENNNFGLDVDFSEHTVEGGTAEGISLAIKRFVRDDDYLVMNGDDLTYILLDKMMEAHRKKKPMVTMGLSTLNVRSSIVDIEDGIITGFRYGGKIIGVYLSMGVYIFNKNIEQILTDKGSIEDLVFAKLANERKMASYLLTERECWYSINTVKELAEVEEEKETWVNKFKT